MATKAELSRLWERVESIREDLGSLADEIAELYGAEEGDDLEAVRALRLLPSGDAKAYL